MGDDAATILIVDDQEVNRIIHGSGVAGRTAIFELMTMNDELRHLIVLRSSAAILKEAALRNEMQLLRDYGWNLVRQGVSTAEEIVRCTKI